MNITPHNLEAEQALLGAILSNNEAMNHVGTTLAPEDFYAGIHQRIFRAILQFNDKGMSASPVTLKRHFAGAEPVEDQYLARLVASATSIINVRDYAQIIRDLSVRRQLIVVCEESIAEAYQAGEGGDSHIETLEHKLFRLVGEGQGVGGVSSVAQCMDRVLERADAAGKRTGEVIGLSTGFSDLNRVLGGLHPSDLVILAGRPSMGKTALATNIARNAAEKLMREDADTKEKPRSVGFFSLEMSADQLSMRLLSGETNISSQDIQNGRLDQAQWARLMEAKREVAAMPLKIDDTPALSIAAIRSRARRMKRVHNIALLVVDYLQLVRGTTLASAGNRVQEVSEITQGLKAIAKELNIPVIALSQLSRAVEQREDKRPQLADLRESGSIEQDADVVMFVYREEYYVGRAEPEPNSAAYDAWAQRMEQARGKAQVIIAKHRNGPIANIDMAFISQSTRFADYLPGAFV